jgi:hypothetical protein
MINCLIWKGNSVAFTVEELVLMNISGEAAIRSTHSSLQLGNHVRARVRTGEKRITPVSGLQDLPDAFWLVANRPANQ